VGAHWSWLGNLGLTQDLAFSDFSHGERMHE
jgi:hypothetical protein